MTVIDSHFSNFVDGGSLVIGDTVVGLRAGLNTKFIYTGGTGIYLPLVGGVMTGSIDMSGNLVFNSGAPSAGGDLTNKTYVDSLIAGASPLTTKGDLYTFTTVNARLPVGSVDGQIVQVHSAAASGLAWSTATYPSTTTINQLLFSSSNNVIAGIATGNNGVLITSAGGVPSISSTLPSAVQTNITALGSQSQALDMNNHLINNVSTPVSNLDAANKQYVDQNALNGTSVYAASAGSLGTVTQSGAGVGATITNAGVQATFTLDGATPPVGTNVLIKNAATGMTSANEGIYTVTDAGSLITNWVLTRATSYDTPVEINETGLILVQNGSTLAGTAWYNAATIVTVDTTAFSYSQFGNIIFPLTLFQGGTNASLTASNGGIVYSTASALAILAGTSTARQMLQSGASGAPAWSTTTWPATSTINRILFSSSANVIGEISTVVSAGLLTNGSGVPAWVTATGTGAPVLGTAPTITSPLINAINDQTYNLPVLGIMPTSSSVNYFLMAGNITNQPPLFSVTGSDPNINMALGTKGTGTYIFYTTATSNQMQFAYGAASALNAAFNFTGTGTGNIYTWPTGSGTVTLLGNTTTGSGSIVLATSPTLVTPTLGAATATSLTFSPTTNGIVGTTTNDNASAGYVGEFKSSVIAAASSVTFTSGSITDLTHVSLTAGDWDVWGNLLALGTTITQFTGWINSSSASPADNSLVSSFSLAVSTNAASPVPSQRISLSTTTNIYISGVMTGTGTITVCGGIYARRVR